MKKSEKIDLDELYPAEWADYLSNILDINSNKYYHIYAIDDFGHRYNGSVGCGPGIVRHSDLISKEYAKLITGTIVPAITLRELNNWINQKYNIKLNFEKFTKHLLNITFPLIICYLKADNRTLVYYAIDSMKSIYHDDKELCNFHPYKCFDK